jgi:hypothetical protein
MQPTVEHDGRYYKVRGKIEIPDFSKMTRFEKLIWLNQHTYATGYSKPTVQLPPINLIVG